MPCKRSDQRRMVFDKKEHELHITLRGELEDSFLPKVGKIEMLNPKEECG